MGKQEHAESMNKQYGRYIFKKHILTMTKPLKAMKLDIHPTLPGFLWMGKVFAIMTAINSFTKSSTTNP